MTHSEVVALVLGIGGSVTFALTGLVAALDGQPGFARAMALVAIIAVIAAEGLVR